METQEKKVHAGHRQRMLEKFSQNPKFIYDYELLEIVLYSFIPRKNTNVIAHDLIRAFGTITGVFNAKVSELMMIKGVGKQTAKQIVIVGALFKEIYLRSEKESPRKGLINKLLMAKEIRKSYVNEDKEKSLILLLNKHYCVLHKLFYEDRQEEHVTADVPEILNVFSLHRPCYIVLAHNHPSGVAKPSKTDDWTTKKLNFLCALHGIKLIDHFIVTDDDYYSYEMEGRLQMIKDGSDLGAVIRAIENNK